MPDHVHDLSSDRRWSRDVLPRVSRTFALNIRLLRGTLGDAVRLAYLLCRAADALEDSWHGTAQEIRDRFAAFTRALAGDAAAGAALAAQAGAVAGGREDLVLLARLPRLLRLLDALPAAHRLAVVEGVTVLATGMSRYAARAASRGREAPYLDTEAELDDYCWVVAGCVGVMLTRLFEAEYGAGPAAVAARRLEAAPIVGRALQLTNILLDWPSDLRRGRCYLPAAWLDELGLDTADLMRPANGPLAPEGPPPAVRELAARLEGRARAALARVPDYLDQVPVRRVRYRLFCLWPALWALGSLRHARLDADFPWGPRRPKLPRGELLSTSLRSLFGAHHGGALRRLYDRVAGARADVRPA